MYCHTFLPAQVQMLQDHGCKVCYGATMILDSCAQLPARVLNTLVLYRIVPNKRPLTRHPGKSGGPEEHYRGFSAIFAYFGQIFAYFEGNIPSERAGAHLSRSVYSALYGIICVLAQYIHVLCQLIFPRTQTQKPRLIDRRMAGWMDRPVDGRMDRKHTHTNTHNQCGLA